MRDPKERLRIFFKAIASIERYSARAGRRLRAMSLSKIGLYVIFRLSVKQRTRFPKNCAINGRKFHGLRS